MTTAMVLLSAGLHPVSGRPCPVPVELQAIGLARSLADTVIGLHAGVAAEWHGEWAGYGIDRLVRIPADPVDPLPALLDSIRQLDAATAGCPILAGRRGQGGEDGGLLPYRLAGSLGRPLLADVVALASAPAGGLALTQWRPQAARRLTMVDQPVLMTIHPAAAPAPAFVFDRARRARIEDWPGLSAPRAPAPPADERPYRRRPPVLELQPAGQGARILTGLSAEAAARALLAHLRAIGLLSPV